VGCNRSMDQRGSPSRSMADWVTASLPSLAYAGMVFKTTKKVSKSVDTKKTPKVLKPKIYFFSGRIQYLWSSNWISDEENRESICDLPGGGINSAGYVRIHNDESIVRVKGQDRRYGVIRRRTNANSGLFLS
jgi:hypothetical protein